MSMPGQPPNVPYTSQQPTNFPPMPPGVMPSQRIQSPASAPPTRSVWLKRVGIGAGMFLSLLIGIGIGGAGTAAPSTATTAQASVPVAQAPAYAQSPVAQAPVEQSVPVVPAVPQGVTAGTYAVGSDVQPGTYKSTGPDGSNMAGCYWERMKDTSGDFGSTIANNISEGPSVVTISAKDGAFKTAGCAPWIKVK